MNNILIEINDGMVAVQLPDASSTFKNQDVVDHQGKRYLFAEYTGSKELVSDFSVEDYLLSVSVERDKANKVVYRIITVAALYKRLGDKLPLLLSISDTLAAEGNYDLKAELMRIDKLEYFNLDDETARPSFLATGQFTTDELDLLFVNGSIDEVPEAQK